jgi:hypothetical protein
MLELMIATALIGVGIIVAAGTFNSVHRSVQYSKMRTLATNIAQEKMQILMQKSYYEVLVTTAPAYLIIGSATIPYDNSDFTPETLTEGGGVYTRYTYIQVVQENFTTGLIQVLPPLTPDTGMRQITITVVWNADSGQKFLTIQNILNNPNTVMASTWLTGTVQDSVSHNPIPGAVVDAAENVGWRDTTNSTGSYTINLVPGTYDFQASASGYYPSLQMCNVVFDGSTSCSFNLQAIATGNVSGTAWIDNHLVISQVVASTGPANNIEYIELYNPTPFAVVIGTNSSATTPSIAPVLWDSAGNNFMHRLWYVNSSIPGYGYYLISNTGSPTGNSTSCSTFTVAGIQETPDACWKFYSAPTHLMECGAQPCNGPTIQDAGGVSIANSSAYAAAIPAPVNMADWPAASIDSIGWSDIATDNPAPPSAVEGSGIIRPNGLVPGDQFVRHADTTTVIGVNGRAYDSNNNAVDILVFSPMVIGPNNSSIIQAPISGTPAAGAHVSITDGLSATSSTTVMGNPPYAQFMVPGIATGTWTVFIDSGTFSAEIDTVAVVANSTTSIPSATTSPAWPATDVYATLISTPGINGIVNGQVTDDYGNPISGITVTAGASSTSTGLNGTYSLRVASGTYDVIANPGNANSTYSSQDQPSVTISIGDVTQNIDFLLPKTGKIQGWISRDGVNPLPGVDAVALDAFGSAHDTEASGNNGIFTLINLTSGTYTIQPVLDTSETSSPLSISATVVPGSTVWIGTFTIIGAMGQVQGSVTVGGQPIKSGVLIVASTQTVSLPPPALSSNTLTSAAYYADTSNESGIYSLSVRGSTTSVYNVTAFYMQLNDNTPVISTATLSNVTVTAGSATTGVNFAW